MNPWPYYYHLERHVIDLSNHVAFTQEHFPAWSDITYSLFTSICQEAESSLRLIHNQRNMSKIIEKIKKAYADIHTLELGLRTQHSDEISLQPFKNFGEKEDWWQDYQDLKHNRMSNKEKANIGNLLNSMGFLWAINAIYSERTDMALTEESVKSALIDFEKYARYPSDSPFSKSHLTCITHYITSRSEDY